MTTPRRRDGEHWAIDKKVPLALLFAVGLQTIALVVFLSGLNSRVGVLEKNDSAKDWQSERIIRMDERLTSMQRDMADIKSLFRQPPIPIPR